MSTPSTLAPENQPSGDWRAAFGTLRTEVVGLEGEVKAIGEKQAQSMALLEKISARVDAIGSAQIGMQSSTGRISAQMLLTMIAVITPIVMAAAALGHVFVQTGDANLTRRIEANETQVDYLRSKSDDLAKTREDVARMDERIKILQQLSPVLPVVR